MIRLEQVSKVYKTSTRPALENVSVEVDKGEFVFLIGASGSGKSTFLRLLLREEVPTKGRVYVANFDVARMARRRVPRLRQSIGCVFQDFRLLGNKTVAENVAFALEVIGKPRHTIRKVVPEVLELVGLEGKAERMPNELSKSDRSHVVL
ncbi:hypothetical protein GCM10023148_23250 [Actinokineospora soli]